MWELLLLCLYFFQSDETFKKQFYLVIVLQKEHKLTNALYPYYS
uniref:Uncharacterized protein n=1 Tax=Lepeophtheirus salmonis TaxID=72036 RepID=A0A0K2UW54_LEPSM